MSTRRIYELARELSLPSRVVLKRAQSLGIAATTASSGLDTDERARVLASYQAATQASAVGPSADENPVSDSLSTTEAESASVPETKDAPDDAALTTEREQMEEIGIDLYPLPPYGARDGASVVREPDGSSQGVAYDLSDRSGVVLSLVAPLIIAANIVMRLSVEVGVLMHGVAIAIAIGFVISNRGNADNDEVPATSWLLAGLVLAPMVVFALVTAPATSSWALPLSFAVPVGLAALWIIGILPDRRIAGLRLTSKDDIVWSLAAIPLVATLAIMRLSESDVYLGNSGGSASFGRLVVLVIGALAIQVVFYGLIHGLAEPLVGRPTVVWVAAAFATTFAASWAGLAALLAMGLILGLLRARFESIWPGFAASVIVFLSLGVL